MKQIDVCLARFFEGKKPLKAKWQARWHPNHPHLMVLYHYHHVVLVLDTIQKRTLKEWWGRPADKRGLEAAKQNLEARNLLEMSN